MTFKEVWESLFGLFMAIFFFVGMAINIFFWLAILGK